MDLLLEISSARAQKWCTSLDTKASASHRSWWPWTTMHKSLSWRSAARSAWQMLSRMRSRKRQSLRMLAEGTRSSCRRITQHLTQRALAMDVLHRCGFAGEGEYGHKGILVGAEWIREDLYEKRILHYLLRDDEPRPEPLQGVDKHTSYGLVVRYHLRIASRSL